MHLGLRQASNRTTTTYAALTGKPSGLDDAAVSKATWHRFGKMNVQHFKSSSIVREGKEIDGPKGSRLRPVKLFTLID